MRITESVKGSTEKAPKYYKNSLQGYCQAGEKRQATTASWKLTRGVGYGFAEGKWLRWGFLEWEEMTT